MNMHCVLIKADRVVGEEVFEVMVEKTINLPKAEDISEIDAEIIEVAGEVVGMDQVEITGMVSKNVYYVGSGGRIYHHAELLPFSDVVMIEGAEPGMAMDVHVHAHIRHVSYQFRDGELYQRVEMEAFVKVTVPEQLDVVIDPTGPLLKVNRVVSEQTIPEVVSGDETLDREAIKIVRIDARLEDITYETAEDQVLVEGMVHKDIYYVGCDNIQYRQVETMPFSTIVPVPGAEPGMDVMIEPRIDRVNYQLQPPLPSDELMQRVLMQVFVKVTESAQINVAQDPCGPLIKAEHVVGENLKQVLLENTIRLRLPALKIQDVHATVKDVHCEVIENKVIIQGMVHKQIFYVDCKHMIRHIGEDIPFSAFVDVPGAMPEMNCQVHGRIEYVKPELVCSRWDKYGYMSEAEDSDGSSQEVEVESRRDSEDAEYEGNATAYRMLHQKVIVELFVKITETIQLRVRLCPMPAAE